MGPVRPTRRNGAVWRGNGGLRHEVRADTEKQHHRRQPVAQERREVGRSGLARKVWREKASIMVAVLGSDAPPDPHWSVPHKNPEWGTWHRVRAK